MNYFFSGLRNDTAKFWLLMIVMGVWVVAILDGLTAGGLAGGKIFFWALGLTVAIPVAYAIGLYIFQTLKGKKATKFNQAYDVFEARRSVEMRETVRLQPDYSTHCYMCIHFNHDKRYCNRKFSADVNQQRVKEITLNNKKYCLYYEEPAVPAGVQDVPPNAPANEPLSEKYRGIK